MRSTCGWWGALLVTLSVGCGSETEQPRPDLVAEETEIAPLLARSASHAESPGDLGEQAAGAEQDDTSSLLKKPSNSKTGATGSASAGKIGQFPSPTSAGRASGTLSQQAARRFLFHYEATLPGLTPGANVRVWLPMPRNDEHQQAELVGQDLPAEPSFPPQSQHRNRALYFESHAAVSGELSMRLAYHVKRFAVSPVDLQHRSTGEQAGGSRSISTLRALYLGPDAKVPVDGKPLQLLAGLELSKDPLTIGRQLFDVVDDHVTYKKEGTGWGQGDVLWVCDSRYGNCTDFHSLFISLARSQEMPARFEIGFPLPPERGQGTIPGYHCWAFFYGGELGWVPVVDGH